MTNPLSVALNQNHVVEFIEMFESNTKYYIYISICQKPIWVPVVLNRPRLIIFMKLITKSIPSPTLWRTFQYKNAGSGASTLNMDLINVYAYNKIPTVPWTYASLRQGDCIFIPAGKFNITL